jgi:hypothetical protein
LSVDEPAGTDGYLSIRRFSRLEATDDACTAAVLLSVDPVGTTRRLSELLTHLYVLVPVLDDQKHYWVGDDEVRKTTSARREMARKSRQHFAHAEYGNSSAFRD